MKEILQVHPQGKAIELALCSRASAETLLAATSLTSDGAPLVAHDGERPRQPPSVRVLLVNLPLGWTMEQVRALPHVRHVVPHRWRDANNVETNIWLTSATIWLAPDSTPTRRLKIGDRDVKVVDPRLPQDKRRRRRRGRKHKAKKEDKDKGTATAAAPPATPAMHAPSTPPAPASGPATPASAASARALFVIPPQDLSCLTDEWHTVERKKKKKGSGSGSDSSDSDAHPPARRAKRSSITSSSSPSPPGSPGAGAMLTD